ncbi:PWWP domain protein [Ichthyophthirius multifiliis]|uniref:PWWP domain protein n=1 Tax=Ichthyophthirius multifiliis TaxID=5932 RepID=G0R656_ICHMU|nr:PWWP domain protein [Ichthyophthirius multifiliis]EGR27055.1 PWWP domain protein [Ichthyophthirius multifiliis]|eukprot:XP_004023939.1 PWWP domain protein [Ichthyophthirius multifiliis]
MNYFKINDLVIAKIQGYPWWPGIVSKVLKINKNGEQQYKYKYKINFIGDNSQQILKKHLYNIHILYLYLFKVLT